jgi:hypothetical protein
MTPQANAIKLLRSSTKLIQLLRMIFHSGAEKEKREDQSLPQQAREKR